MRETDYLSSTGDAKAGSICAGGLASVIRLIPVLLWLLVTTATAGTLDGAADRALIPVGESVPSSARLIHDYGAFALYQLEAGHADRLAADREGKAIQFGADMDWIHLDSAPFRGGRDKPAVPDEFIANYGREAALHLVQFIGPLHQAWFDALKATGAQPVHYIDSNAYLVWADQSARDALDAEAATRSMLQVSEPFHAWFKMGPMVREMVSDGNRSRTIPVQIQFFRHDQFPANRDALISQASAVIEPPSNVLGYQNLVLELTLDQALAAAHLPDVTWVERYIAPERFDEVQNQILAGQLNAAGTEPVGPGYLDWLVNLGFSQNHADYPIVDVTDDGLGDGSVVNGAGDDTLTQERDGVTSRVEFNINCHSGTSSAQGDDGHGHINASIAVGYDQRDGFPFRDSNGFQLGQGVNPFGRVGSTRIFAPTFDMTACGGEPGVIAANYDSGARISNNSWGCAGCAGSYNTSSQAYDAGVRDALPGTSGNQQMIYVFAAGNSGGSATVGTPGNGKNMITVGASENVRPTWTDGCNIPPSGADNAMDVIGFSSRGPAPGGRAKPEIIAPGTHIQGTASTSSSYGGAGVCDQFHPPAQTVFAASSGTSHAAPAVAGAASLVWWWLEEHHSLTPSPAMMKAYLMAHPTYLTGVGAGTNLPTTSQGYGMPNLELAFDDGDRFLLDQTELFTATGQTWQETLQIPDASRPTRITLAYTDQPGATGTSPQVNRLTLTVEAGGNVYNGNVFSGQWSTTGGSPDLANNYSAVFLPAGLAGAVTITVTAANISGDGVPGNGQPLDQDFALVCYNCLQSAGFVLESGTDSIRACAGSDEDLLIDALALGGFSDPVSFSTAGLPTGASASFLPPSLVPDNPAVSSTLTISTSASLAASDYPFTVLGDSSGPGLPPATAELPLTLQVSSQLPASPALLAPADGANLVTPTPVFQWSSVNDALEYLLEVADSPSFASPLYSAVVAGTSHAVSSALPSEQTLYWRVSAINACGSGSAAAMASFSITGPVCSTSSVAIPDGVAAGINDTLTLSAPGELGNMQVYLRASHTWVGDLRFILTSPSGTEVVLLNRPGVGGGSTFGCGNNNIDVTLSDAGSGSAQDACSSTPPAIGGVLTPAEPLSAFIGEPMAGTWTLNAADLVTPDPGVLEEWCLIPAENTQPVIELDPDSVSTSVGADLTETVPVDVANIGTAALDWQFTATGLFAQSGLRRVLAEATLPETISVDEVEQTGSARMTTYAGMGRSVQFAPSAPRTGTSLTHSVDEVSIDSPLTVACGSDGFTSQNAYIRTFTLSDFGITDAFNVEEVTFGVEQSTAPSTPITINLYSLDGALQYANMTPIGSATQNLASQSLTLVTVPVSGQVPAGGTLVVEILSPDQSGVAAFRAGANSAGETAPSYVAAPACSIPEPVTMASIEFEDVHLVMTVTGRMPIVCTAPDDIPWLTPMPVSGSVAAGTQQSVALTFDASGLSAGLYADQLCVQSNDPLNSLLPLPVEMNVVDTYDVGGTVSGLSGAGLVLQNNGAADLAVSANGSFSFAVPVADGASYSVTVLAQPSGQVCTVSNGSGIVSGAAVTDVDVSCVTASGDQALLVDSVNLGAIVSSSSRASAEPIVVNFPVAFSAVPVVIVMPGNEGTDPRSVRIRNVTATGFELLPVTSPPGDGSGPPMTVHYIAATPGDYPLPVVGGGTGPRVQVGRWDTSTIQYNPSAFPPNALPEDNNGSPGGACSQTPAPGWDSRSFSGPDFASAPVLLATVQSWNNEGANLNGDLDGPSAPFMNVALQNIGVGGFDGAIELSEVRRNVPCSGLAGDETIGFVAIEDNINVLLEPSGGGSPITLVTGIGIAHRGEANDPPTWSTSHCRDNDLSVTGSFVEANLRGFAALRSRAEADGGWLRRCSVSSPTAGTLRIALRIDEDNHFDIERRQTPVPATAAEIRDEPVSVAIFGGDFVTTPVSLAWMKVERLSSTRVQVDWATETEVGHVGFKFEARGRDGRWQTLGGLIPGRGYGELGGDDYSVALDVPVDTIELRLVDIDQFGQRRLQTPVAIGAEQGLPPEPVLTDWAGIAARNALYPVSTRAAPGGTTAVARVAEPGLQRLSHADLLSVGVDLGGQRSDHIAVWTGGQPQARHVGGPEIWGEGSYLEWLGEPSDSRYHATRAYRIGIDPASAIAVPAGRSALPGAGPRIERHAIRFERNRRYSPTSPADDPWFDARLSTTGNPVAIEREFELGPRAPGVIELAVDVWGGLDYTGEEPDHHVELWLNGEPIASHWFDGIVAERIEVELVEAWLEDTNILTIRLPGDTGYPADVVQFDGFTVTLPRYSAFDEGGGQGAVPMSGNGERVFHSRFETRQAGFLVEAAPAGAVIWSETPTDGLTRLVHDDGALWLPEDTSAWTGAGPGHFNQPAVQAAVAPAEPEAADYLIISHPQFADHLQPLIDLQHSRGLSVAVARTDEIYAGFGHDEPVPQAIADFIATQATAQYVLLVGGDHVDYRGYLGNDAVSFIPTFYRQADAIVRHAPDELAFVDRSGDDLPDAALGRLPVRSVDELERLLAAIAARDHAGPAERQLFISGGSGGFHERFGHDARVLGSISDDSVALSFAAVDEVGTLEARQLVSDGLAGQTDWLSYLGHSAPDRWGFEPLLRHAQLGAIFRDEAPAIISQWGCWNNWFVSPTQDAMIHGLMLGEQVKASAVLGSVSLAEDASHFALATRFYSLRAHGGLHGEPGLVTTLGSALLKAQRDLIEHEPAHRGAARSVVLFGDPAQPLR